MAIYPVPSDGTYDYVPTTYDRVQVGSDVLAVMSSAGTVMTVIPGTTYVYLLASAAPDGSTYTGLAFMPETWSSLPDDWWLRLRMWKRTAKPDRGDTHTAADGSEWIYPAEADGRMVCYLSGTTHTRGERLSRGEIETDPRDLYVADDAEADWLPVTDASTVVLGDYVQFGYAQTGVVDEITSDPALTYIRHVFERADDDTLGWWDEPIPGGMIGSGNVNAEWAWFDRLPKPDDGSTFEAADGSAWIYTAGEYFAWASGSQFLAGSVRLRGDIAGGLTQIS